ncbi:MAG: hypothetical protein JWN32_4459 [Solirubrobacterales bacterium]|jgi:hypothetical protein|nr:hypothetical protein [Solirubrobacterales bacterium]
MARLTRIALLLCAAVCVVGLSACFKKEPQHHTADTEGIYVTAGQLTYQVQLSRELNPAAVEDQAYLRGLPPLTTPPTPQEEWFAVWMRTENLTRKTAPMVSDFEITDTQGNVYRPLPLTPANELRYIATKVPAHTTFPRADSLAFFSPTQGQELLFKINVNAYQNRPLTLHLLGSGSPAPTLAEVTLDL